MNNNYKMLRLLKGMIFSVLILSGLSIPSFSQVGFNNPDPDSSALIDMKATDMGLLIPRMDSVAKRIMANKARKPAHSLLIFDLNNNMFFAYDTISSGWTALNPFKATSSTSDITTATSGNVGIGTNNPSAKLDVNGSIKSNANISATGTITSSSVTASNITSTGNITASNTVTATKFVGDGIVPKGAILMWSGTTIPTGWALCDGNNGTPDLRGRFIVGYNSSDPDYNWPGNKSTGGTSNGNTGGEKQHTLTTNEMPSHRHNISQSSAAGAYVLYDGNAASGGEGNHVRSTPTAYPMNFNSDYQGGGQPHENRPPYYTLAYIMKL